VKGSHTYSVDETARMLGISRTTAYRQVQRGAIPSVRFGKAIRVPKAQLMAMLGEDDRRTTGGAPALGHDTSGEKTVLGERVIHQDPADEDW